MGCALNNYVLMTSPSRKRPVRNVVLAIILAGVTIVLIVTRLGPLIGDGPTSEPADEYTAIVEPTPPTPPTLPTPPTPPTLPTLKSDLVETVDLTFAEFAEQYAALRGNFRSRDSLTALITGKHVVWEGHLRTVTRHTNSFYVAVWPSTSYGGATASVTFDPAFEDQLYALHPEDRVRFEGVVSRAGGSVGIEGTAIEQIE